MPVVFEALQQRMAKVIALQTCLILPAFVPRTRRTILILARVRSMRCFLRIMASSCISLTPDCNPNLFCWFLWRSSANKKCPGGGPGVGKGGSTSVLLSRVSRFVQIIALMTFLIVLPSCLCRTRPALPKLRATGQSSYHSRSTL